MYKSVLPPPHEPGTDLHRGAPAGDVQSIVNRPVGALTQETEFSSPKCYLLYFIEKLCDSPIWSDHTWSVKVNTHVTILQIQQLVNS